MLWRFLVLLEYLTIKLIWKRLRSWNLVTFVKIITSDFIFTHFLNLAAKQIDPLKRMKYVIAFFVISFFLFLFKFIVIGLALQFFRMHEQRTFKSDSRRNLSSWIFKSFFLIFIHRQQRKTALRSIVSKSLTILLYLLIWCTVLKNAINCMELERLTI